MKKIGSMVAVCYKWKDLSKIQAEKEAYNQRYSEKHDGHRWYFNETGYTVPMHEIGHVYINEKELPEGFSSASRNWARLSKCDMLQTPTEAWAEAWASYHTGINIDRVPQDVIEFIKGASQ